MDAKLETALDKIRQFRVEQDYEPNDLIKILDLLECVAEECQRAHNRINHLEDVMQGLEEI